MSLSREAFLKPVTAPKEVVSLPDLGGDVLVIGMTAKGRSTFENQFSTATGKPNKRARIEFRERLIIATVHDEQGQKLFTDGDVAVLGEQPATVIEPLVNAAQRVCGMTDQDIESMAKNSEETATSN